VFLQNKKKIKKMGNFQYLYTVYKNTLWSKTLKLQHSKLIIRNTPCISFHNMLKTSSMNQTRHVIIADVFAGCMLRCLRQLKSIKL